MEGSRGIWETLHLTTQSKEGDAVGKGNDARRAIVDRMIVEDRNRLEALVKQHHGEIAEIIRFDRRFEEQIDLIQTELSNCFNLLSHDKVGTK